MSDFCDLLKKVREESHYPTSRATAEICGLNRKIYLRYENGKAIPSLRVLDRIISRLLVPEKLGQELRRLRMVEGESRYEAQVRAEIDPREVAAKIQRELEYELKRVGGIEVTPRTRRVCKVRIEMILKHALGME